jgi:hypothetical protein
MTEITERLLVAIASVINDVRSMQNQENKDWFDGFTVWEFTGDEESETDRMSIEWPNLVRSIDNLDAAFKEIYELRQAKVQAEIDEITTKMVQK